MSHYQAILRKFPRLMPGGVRSFEELHGVSADLEVFATLARCSVSKTNQEKHR
jgi:hypothetical protein